MTLFIDGDAFPNLLKPIVLKAIERLNFIAKNAKKYSDILFFKVKIKKNII